jgi:hypothetical protein
LSITVKYGINVILIEYGSTQYHLKSVPEVLAKESGEADLLDVPDLAPGEAARLQPVEPEPVHVDDFLQGLAKSTGIRATVSNAENAYSRRGRPLPEYSLTVHLVFVK